MIRRVKARPGGTRKWATTSKNFAKGKTCWLRLPGCTIRATGIDHYYPVSSHPWLEEVENNWRPACRHCNSARRHTPVQDLPALHQKMERSGKYRNPPALGFFDS
jgi:hypothetical protein